MSTIGFTTKQDGVLSDATSVVLSNAAGTIGIKRNDTGVSVVAADTTFTKTATGTYSYDFTPPSVNVFYTAYVKVVASSSTAYHTIVFYVGADTSSILVPSAVVAEYVIETLGTFSAPTSNTTWPLFRSNLPDGPHVVDDIAAVFDISGYLQSKAMNGDLAQRYGIQFIVRSEDYDTGYRKLASLLSSFENLKNVTVTINSQTFTILNVSQTSTMATMGVEPGTKQRYHFSVNLLVTIR